MYKASLHLTYSSSKYFILFIFILIYTIGDKKCCNSNIISEIKNSYLLFSIFVLIIILYIVPVFMKNVTAFPRPYK